MAGLLLNFVDFRQHGKAGPLPGPYIVEIMLMAGCITLALTRQQSPPVASTRALPRLWLLRMLGFFGPLLELFLPSLFMGTPLPFPGALAIYAAVLFLLIWRVATWSRREGWNARHMLALASGALGFFIFLWAPILEFAGIAGGKPTRGTVVVALAYLILLIVLARRVGPPPPTESSLFTQGRSLSATAP